MLLDALNDNEPKSCLESVKQKWIGQTGNGMKKITERLLHDTVYHKFHNK